jgi:hypothetical protein
VLKESTKQGIEATGKKKEGLGDSAPDKRLYADICDGGGGNKGTFCVYLHQELRLAFSIGMRV